ncbi:hypothetical protein G3N55_07270 [Dissulfurirhabdus thermomarina]|uniref:Uncharacterized protein n=1 Tax=Dissulfurirhabdus thermomarina TaxID=1765737 RepID=A0A6N9TMX3_DISTH|nr:hypothetical protein [Dissulfurirhabdus thermomarina]NDY42641.1 hypothetical protein [Dissulfurirhabdus thermomarina]NMX22687.1 hypothetical protein [Dissulfurirhabdus thermomarina]
MGGQNGKGHWARERRELLVRNVFRDFAAAREEFVALEADYRSYGISFDRIAEWVGTEGRRGPLWRLKDDCHRLWRSETAGERPEVFLFDWTVGAIFHEAVKLKENAYLVHAYQPAFLWAGEAPEDGAGVEGCLRFCEQTMEDVEKGVARLGAMFEQAAGYLRRVFAGEKENGLLLRFLIENRRRMDRLWAAAGGIEAVFREAFPMGPEMAYCLAGESYVEGDWYAEARAAFQRALVLNPECYEARIGLDVLDKRLREVSETLDREAAQSWAAYRSGRARGGILPRWPRRSPRAGS